ncbi:MAG TPA: phosphate ABC transporter permease PstA [Candidatus Saccharimonadales bacterium]|nr:phosphate ABC transporter permease PstA [Candidatus Saccharimonadales bacterium]
MSTAASVMARVPERHAVSARRRARERTMQALVALSAVGAAALLVIILGYVIVRGAPALNLAFFTERPLPFGVEGGGVGPALVGTVILSLLAGVIAIPIGIASAIFVTEFRSGRLAPAVRFAAELIAGLPSIVVGVFVWAFLVRGIIGHYAALAGAIALAIIMIPIVARTVEEVLRLVPQSLREAGLALGAPRWRVVLSIVVPTARAGIATAVVLAVARAAGETAPLLLTALGNLFFSTDLLKPVSALPLQIYQYAASPYDDWHTKAWGSSLVLVGVIALLSLALRLAIRRGAR